MEHASSSGDKKRQGDEHDPLPRHQRYMHHSIVDSSENRDILSTGRSQRRVSTSSRDTMQQSLSPSDGLLDANRTKTGRISKATKGRPVHHCECGKTYTRAEHLRRHQQNHKPGAFACDIAGCNRAFYRDDLLLRHKAKHHGVSDSPGKFLPPYPGQELEPPTSTSSPKSSSLAPLPTSNVDTATTLDVDRTFALNNTGSHVVRHVEGSNNLKSYRRESELQLHPGIGIDPSGMGIDFVTAPNGGMWELSSWQSIQSVYNTPEHAYQQYELPQTQPLVDFSQPWTTSASRFYGSSSPISTGSAAPLQHWGMPGCGQESFEDFTSGRSGSDVLGSTSGAHDPLMLALPSTETGMLPEIRDLLEQEDLATPTFIPQAADFGPNQCHHRRDNEQRYLSAFWETIHPLWPILHKPSFNMACASPLLRASMLALGAQSTGMQIDAGNACILHKRCLKVLQKRTVSNQHTYRICDMQAVLLVEIFSAFRSRRQPFHLSQYFTDAYQTLAYEVDLDAAEMPNAPLNYFNDHQHDTFKGFGIEHKERLLAAFYLLDQQHAAMFGRQKTCAFENIHAILFYPRPLNAWDSSFTPSPGSDSTFADPDLISRPTLQQALEETYHPNAANDLDEPDFFTSTLLSTYTAEIQNDHDDSTQRTNLQAPNPPAPTSPLIDLTTQTLNLCKTTPVRALLATAGESWIMGEKLTSHAEFAAAKQEVRQWAASNNNNESSSAASSQALTHALRILRLHRVHHTSPLLFHEWSLHLAALVIWACAYASREPSSAKRLRLSIPSSETSSRRDGGLEDSVRRLACVDGGRSGIAWAEARASLVWAAARMEKSSGGGARFCGVVSGAVDVLRRLGARGDEVGWF